MNAVQYEWASTTSSMPSYGVRQTLRMTEQVYVNLGNLATRWRALDHQEIKELDLNPIIVYEKGAKTVDARIILE